MQKAKIYILGFSKLMQMGMIFPDKNKKGIQ